MNTSAEPGWCSGRADSVRVAYLCRGRRATDQRSFDKSGRLCFWPPVAWAHAEGFEKHGYRFFFYSNEHRPIHVHVRYGGGEAVFEVEQRVDLRESQGLRVRELTKAEELATEHRGLIIERWNEHFNR